MFSHTVILLSSMQCVKGYMVTLMDFDYQYLYLVKNCQLHKKKKKIKYVV